MHLRAIVLSLFGATVAALIAVACSGGDERPVATAPAAPREAPPLHSEHTPAAAPATRPPTPASAAVSDASPLVVAYRDGAFAPKRLEVPVGVPVQFVNESSTPFWPASNIHPTHAIYPEFDAKTPIQPGQSWAFIFNKAGFWRYHNHLTPEQSGLVVAQSGAPQPAAATPTPAPAPAFKAPPRLTAADASRIFNDSAQLTKFVKDYGPGAAVRALVEHAPHIGLDCHQGAHHIGRISYELFGAAAYGLATHDCQSGTYHGTTEAFFRERGTTDLAQDVQALCGSERNAFSQHQCVHGVGHGLMAWTTYELHDALALCDTLRDVFTQQSCHSGVFMENVVGGLSGLMGHRTEYLSNDPHFPCNALEDRYVFGCYFFQSSRMLDLFQGDFRKVAQACAEAPAIAHTTCFRSMGRDVDSRTKGHPERAIDICRYPGQPQQRVDCLIGAIQDAFWEAGDAETGLKFCRLLDDPGDKRVCYTEITGRARQVLPDQAALGRFCARIEERYRAGCS